MSVRNAENLQHALDGAVLAGTTMQHVEGDVGLERAQQAGDVAPDIDAGHAIAAFLERVGAGAAGSQAHLPLGRPATHQDRDVLGQASVMRAQLRSA